MPIRSFKRPRALAIVSAVVLLGATLRVPALAAQSLAVGELTATIMDERGAPLQEVTVTLERGTSALRTKTTNSLGLATFSIVPPGSYSVLVEEFGYQPVRMSGVAVVSGGRSSISVKLIRRPPPITTVEEQPSNAVIVASSMGSAATGAEITSFDFRHDITGVPGMFSDVNVPRDGREGYLTNGNGLRPGYSSLIVDGMPETLMRHPGLPSEPASAPLFARDGVDEVLSSGFGPSTEWPGALGSVLSATTRRGPDRFTFQPWATFSGAKLGGRTADNPGDSSATSIQAGVSMGGPIKHDTASWFIRADYQQLEQPSANPFEPGQATADSAPNLAGAIRTAAETLGHQDVSAWLAPTVRTWKGGSASGRLDWRFGQRTLFAVRAGGASWTEDNPQAGIEAVNGAGSHLDAQDFSAAAALTTGNEGWTSDTRVGLRTTKRDWSGAALPFTSLVGDAVAIGGAATLPGNFKETGIDLSEALTFHLGDHSLTTGASVEHRDVTYDWIPGGAGEFEFGDLATFAANSGAFYQAIASGPAPSLGVTNLGLFLEDSWQATPALQLFGGVRLDHEALPSDAIAVDAEWGRVTGLPNNVVPTDRTSRDFGPRGGFMWDLSGDGRTTVRGSAAVVPGEYDLASLAEAARFDGGVEIRRATGTLTWPEVGASAGTNAGAALTMFAADVRKPRSFKADLALIQRLGSATTLTVAGGYRHGDYLLQSEDLNRVAGTVATGSDGRPIYGSLEQFGGLVTPAVGSNRRFQEFDMVYGLTSTGYNDYYEADLTLEHRLSHQFAALITYTYSRTTDNLPGELSADPADHLSPFPGGLNGARWEDGKSDLDIPHRIAATLTYTTPGKSPFTVAARYRYRSGLPFTPGFRAGVDANGDGSGNNDPAYVATAIPGMAQLLSANPCLAAQTGQFAARNSCRDVGVHTVDLRASLVIAHGWALTLDGFNLVGTTTGWYDHAAVLVDPKGTITTNASGQTVLPLIANPGFGSLLSRRGEPRVLRVGIRVEN